MKNESVLENMEHLAIPSAEQVLSWLKTLHKEYKAGCGFFPELCVTDGKSTPETLATIGYENGRVHFTTTISGERESEIFTEKDFASCFDSFGCTHVAKTDSLEIAMSNKGQATVSDDDLSGKVDLSSLNRLERTTLFTDMLRKLQPIMSATQRQAIIEIYRGEESMFALERLVNLGDTFDSMPSSYETDGQGDEAVVHLHYFTGGCDWYITEKDMEDEQVQAFGMADLGHGGELGYINLQELARVGAEIDLHWEPQTLAHIKGLKQESSSDIEHTSSMELVS